MEMVVERNTDLVYAAARRQVNDHHLAEDITQAVFVALARKKQRLDRGVMLAAWLHRATRFAALHLCRTENLPIGRVGLQELFRARRLVH